MRWKKRKPICFRRGDQRTRSGFLIIPRCINYEWRWLERATWVEEVVERTACIPETRTTFKYLDWRRICWVDAPRRVV